VRLLDDFTLKNSFIFDINERFPTKEINSILILGEEFVKILNLNSILKKLETADF
jgi:hypothetical protein